MPFLAISFFLRAIFLLIISLKKKVTRYVTWQLASQDKANRLASPHKPVLQIQVQNNLSIIQR